MTKVIKPNSVAQHNEWVSKLNEAGRPYTIVDVEGKAALLVEEGDAAEILGIAEPPAPAPPPPAKKRLPAWVRIPLWIAAGLVAIALFTREPAEGGATDAEPVVLDSAELRLQIIKKQFSAWDGSHMAVTQSIKKGMNDPRSYDHVETVYYDKGDHLQVRTRFRGKNAFGGVVINTVNAKVDLQGRILEIALEE